MIAPEGASWARVSIATGFITPLVIHFLQYVHTLLPSDIYGT